MDPNAYAHQLNALKTRVRQQASALAESEALALENMQYVAELEQQVTELQQQTVGLQEHADRLQQQAEGYQQQLTQLDGHQGELQHLKTELSTCQSSQQTQTEAVSRLEAELIEALETCTQLEEELTAANQCCQHLEAASSEQAQELQGRITTLEGDRDRLARQSQESIEAKDILANQLANSRVEVETLATELEALKQEMDPLKQQLSEAIAHVTAAGETANANAEDALKQAQRRQEVAEANHYVIKRQYDALQNRVKELEEECAQAHTSGRDRERDLTELGMAHEDLKVVFERLQTQNRQLQTALDEQSQQSLGPSPELQAQLEQLQQEHDRLTALAAERSEQLQEAHQAAAVASAESARLRAQMFTLTQRQATELIEAETAQSTETTTATLPTATTLADLLTSSPKGDAVEELLNDKAEDKLIDKVDSPTEVEVEAFEDIEAHPETSWHTEEDGETSESSSESTESVPDSPAELMERSIRPELRLPGIPPLALGQVDVSNVSVGGGMDRRVRKLAAASAETVVTDYTTPPTSGPRRQSLAADLSATQRQPVAARSAVATTAQSEPSRKMVDLPAFVRRR